jgi:hypothetical protein
MRQFVPWQDVWITFVGRIFMSAGLTISSIRIGYDLRLKNKMAVTAIVYQYLMINLV